MLDVQLDVRRLFVESFTSVTEKIAGFPLRCCADKKEFKTGQNVKIHAEGVFSAYLYISMEDSFEDAVLNGMTNGKKLSSDMRALYVGEYINIGSKIECRCLKCENVWHPPAGNLIGGKSQCPKCSKINSALLRKKSHEDFLQTIQSLNPNVEILGEYLSNKKRIKCKCKICGKIWNPISGSLLQGCGCSSCAYKVRGKNRRTTQLDFVDKLSKSNPGIEIIGEYSGAFEPIKCKCKVCGNIWSPRAHDVLLGSGCPECSNSATSFLEQFILK